MTLLKKPFELPDKKTLQELFLIGIGGAFGTLFYTLGIALENVSIVAAITFSNPLIATLYGKFVYKERLSQQQYLAIAFIILGIILISMM